MPKQSRYEFWRGALRDKGFWYLVGFLCLVIFIFYLGVWREPLLGPDIVLMSVLCLSVVTGLCLLADWFNRRR